MQTKIAINGLGRIGRAFLKIAIKRPELKIVAVNDLGDIKNMEYLLKYDTAYGASNFSVTTGASKNEVNQLAFFVDGKEVLYLSEKDPKALPWKKLGVDVVVESTGLFTSYEKARVHLDAGAKRVVLSAPSKDEVGATEASTVLMGVNEQDTASCPVTSNASCTTNAGSPLIAILDEAIGIEKAILNTVHGYTASQSLVDGISKKDFREGRAAGQNIVPSSTGAAIAVTKAYPSLVGKFDGISVRVPVVVGSIVDITFIAKKLTTKEEVNEILRGAAAEPRWKGIFTVTDEPLVSSDVIGNPHASIADLAFTRVVDGNLVKVMAWYDNEMGYTHTLVEHVIKAGKLV